MITNVYGPQFHHQTMDFFRDMEHVRVWVNMKNWILGEYLNRITSLCEKKGGSQSLEAINKDFGDLIEILNLVDMETRNQLFT